MLDIYRFLPSPSVLSLSNNPTTHLSMLSSALNTDGEYPVSSLFGNSNMLVGNSSNNGVDRQSVTPAVTSSVTATTTLSPYHNNITPDSGEFSIIHGKMESLTPTPSEQQRNHNSSSNSRRFYRPNSSSDSSSSSSGDGHDSRSSSPVLWDPIGLSKRPRYQQHSGAEDDSHFEQRIGQLHSSSMDHNNKTTESPIGENNPIASHHYCSSPELLMQQQQQMMMSSSAFSAAFRHHPHHLHPAAALQMQTLQHNLRQLHHHHGLHNPFGQMPITLSPSSSSSTRLHEAMMLSAAAAVAASNKTTEMTGSVALSKSMDEASTTPTTPVSDNREKNVKSPDSVTSTNQPARNNNGTDNSQPSPISATPHGIEHILGRPVSASRSGVSQSFNSVQHSSTIQNLPAGSPPFSSLSQPAPPSSALNFAASGLSGLPPSSLAGVYWPTLPSFMGNPALQAWRDRLSSGKKRVYFHFPRPV